MCRGDGCLLSLKCKRFVTDETKPMFVFTDAPYRVTVTETGTETNCEYFINNEYEEGRIRETEPNGIEETKQDTGN